jgi:hypothetical protein
MRQRQACDHCAGRFGMVTYRWWGSKFCTRACKDAYLREGRSAETKSFVGTASFGEQLGEVDANEAVAAFQ